MQPPFSALQRDADDDTWAGMIPTARESVLFRAASSFDPQKNFHAAYDGSKAEEVMNVPELAEHILSFLDFSNIIKTTRVCKQLRATLDSSEKLRTITFLAPTPQKAGLVQMPTHFNRARMTEDIDNKDHHFFSSRVNPTFFDPVRFDSEANIFADMKEDAILKFPPRSNACLLIEAGRAKTELYMYLRVDNGDHPTFTVEEGLARNMVLTYQPRSTVFELRIRRSWRCDRFRVTLAKNITAGGLVDFVNTIWRCACDPAIAWDENGSISKEVLEGKATEFGETVTKWLESDIRVLRGHHP